MDISAIRGTRRRMKEMADGTLRVEIDIDPPFKQAFYTLFPSIDMPVGMAPLDPKEAVQGTETQKREPNTLAQKMHIDGYFRNPKLWAALERAKIYTQAEHKAYIESLPCCWNEAIGFRIKRLYRSCEGDICAHHVTSADLPAAGDTTDNPNKVPHWYTAPLCWITHHNNGVHGPYADREAKKALQVYAIELTAQQVKAKMKEYLGIESLSEITQEMLTNFERAIGL